MRVENFDPEQLDMDTLEHLVKWLRSDGANAFLGVVRTAAYEGAIQHVWNRIYWAEKNLHDMKAAAKASEARTKEAQAEAITQRAMYTEARP